MGVNWSNGHSTDYSYTSYDWFLLNGTPGPNSGVAISGLDRTLRGSDVTDNNTVNPTLFYYDIDLSGDPNYAAGALVDSVTAMYLVTSAPNPVEDNILGLSGSVAVPEPSALLLTTVAGVLGVIPRRCRARIRRPKTTDPNKRP